MPKLTNFTMEEKAEKYADLRKKWAVNMTMEERAMKWDEHIKTRSKQCKKYADKNPDKIKQISKDHYEVNKIEYNKKACIRIKEHRELYNKLQNIRRQKIRDLKNGDIKPDPTEF